MFCSHCPVILRFLLILRVYSTWYNVQISKFFATRPLAISYPSPPTFGVLCCNVCSLITWITCWKPIVNLQDSTCPWATRHSNLVSRLSLLCVLWSLEERLWLWPVIWTPRIWVVKNMLVGGVKECLDCCCGKLWGFQNLKQSLKTTCFIRVWHDQWRMLHYFCRVQILEHLIRSQRNAAADWSSNFSTVSTYKTLLMKSNLIETNGWVSWSWIFEFGGNLFSSLCSILDVKKYSCHTAV